MKQEASPGIFGAAILIALLIVGTMESQVPATLQEKVLNCVRSMGSVTDEEINQALDQCARRFNYILVEEDYP